jgi:hypothetical protein
VLVAWWWRMYPYASEKFVGEGGEAAVVADAGELAALLVVGRVS